MMRTEVKMKNKKKPIKLRIATGTTALLFLLLFPYLGLAQAPQVRWVEGPGVVDIGKNVAQIELGEEYLFANSADTQKLMEYIGNPTSKSEVGMIISKDQTKEWFILFSHYPIGYIKDEDKDSIDADALLASIRKGTERGNKIRKKKGFPTLEVVGWYEEPHYDELTNNLVWALLVEDQGGQFVNYDVRLLGRSGYMSATLVTDPGMLDVLKPEVEGIISNYSYKDGNRYAEFRKGDKIAKLGLTALIAGGAGAAAVKFGLLNILAKAWKAVVAAVVGLFAAFRKKIARLFGRGSEGDISMPE